MNRNNSVSTTAAILLTFFVSVNALATSTNAAPSAADVFGGSSCTALFGEIPIKSVEDFILRQTPVLTQMAQAERERAFGSNAPFSTPLDRTMMIHTDTLACRICGWVSDRLETSLNSKFPLAKFKTVISRSLAHMYNYSFEWDIIVDGTYRQFVIGLPVADFELLPKIFVGSPQLFRELMASKMSDEAIEDYLTAIKQ